MWRSLAQFDEFGNFSELEHGPIRPLLEAMSFDGRHRFHEMARTRTVSPGTVVIANGQISAEVGFVVAGTLAMSKLLADGREQIIGLLVPAGMFGRLFGGPSRYDVAALSHARLLCFQRPMFETLLSREPAAEHLLLGQLLDELDLARESLLLLNGSRVVSRVATFLLMLVRHSAGQFMEPREAIAVQVPLRRADLASYLGTRPETLSRAFHELEHRGVIRILDPYKFWLTDLPRLLEISGQGLASLELRV